MSKQENKVWKVSRRQFMKATGLATGGLVLGVGGFLQACDDPDAEGPAHAIGNWPDDIMPNMAVYIAIAIDGAVTLVAHRSEMGQGVRTALPLIIADELEADWDRVTVVQAEGDEAKYGDQNTDGSFTVRMFYEPMRRAGATARRMLEYAAAAEWGVEVSEVEAKNHRVAHKTDDRSLDYGEIVALNKDWQNLTIDGPQLKKKADRTRIGKVTPIVDLHDMVTGQAGFGIDAKVEGMKVAVIDRPPVVGSSLKSYDREAALAVPGVVDVVELPLAEFPASFQTPKGGVAVLADHTWAAMEGRKALKTQWESGPHGTYNTTDYMAAMEATAKQAGTIRRENGDIKSKLATADQVVEATYLLPHLSHTPMEPPCALAKVDGNSCEIWAPTQHPQWTRDAVTDALGFTADQVRVNVTLLGGGFGRKSKPDFIVEAALLAKQVGYPVKVQWTREDDVRHDFYHSPSVQHVRVALQGNQVTGWHHRSVFPPIGGTTNADNREPSDGEVSLGLINFPYALDATCFETGAAEAHTRIGWLRSVANIQHAFAVGSALDEVAQARGMDPKDNLLDLLGPDRILEVEELGDKYRNHGEPLEKYPVNTARLRTVIERVAQEAGWGKDLGPNKGLGICAHRSFLTYVACVVEVEVKDNKIHIPAVHYAVDCGVAVNTDRIKSQFEGGANFALSGAIRSAITFKDGAVEQSNFHDYQVARMSDTPGKVHVHIIESEEAPTGVGEPPVPPFTPALCNALFAATGQRFRKLPIEIG